MSIWYHTGSSGAWQADIIRSIDIILSNMPWSRYSSRFQAGKSTPYPICPGLAGVVQSVLQVSASRQKLESRLALWVTGQYYLVLIEIIPMSSFRLYYDVMLYISRPTLFLVLNDNPPPQIMQAAANIIQDVSLMYVIVD